MAEAHSLTAFYRWALIAATSIGVLGAQREARANEASLIKAVSSHEATELSAVSVAHASGRLATLGSSGDRTVMVWDLPTGKSLLGVESPFYRSSLHLTGDGTQLIVVPRPVKGSPSPKGGLRMARWKVDDGSELAPIPISAESVPKDLAASAKATYLAGFTWKTVWIWRLADGRKVFEKTLETEIRSLAFAPDGKTLFVCGVGDIQQLGLPRGEVVQTYDRGAYQAPRGRAPDGLAGAIGAAVGIAFSADEKHFAASYVATSGYYRVGYWKIGESGLIAEGGGVKGPYVNRSLGSPAFAPDGEHLLAMSDFRSTFPAAILFSSPQLEEGTHFRPSREKVLAAAFWTEPSEVLTVGQGIVRRWSIASGENTGAYSLLGNHATPLALYSLPGGKALSVGDTNLVLWNLERGSVERSYSHLATTTTARKIASPTLTPNQETLVFLQDKHLVRWSVPDWKETARVSLGGLSPKWAKVSADGMRAVCSPYLGKPRLVDFETGTLHDAKFENDRERWMVAASDDLATAVVTPKKGGAPSLLNLASGELGEPFEILDSIKTKNLHVASVGGRFTDDGSVLVTYGRDGRSVYVWDLATKKMRHALPAGLSQLQFASPTQLIAAASRQIKRFDLESGAVEVLSERGPAFSGALSFDKETGQVVAVNKDGALSVWQLEE